MRRGMVAIALLASSCGAPAPSRDPRDPLRPNAGVAPLPATTAAGNGTPSGLPVPSAETPNARADAPPRDRADRDGAGGKRLTLAEARRYMLALINRDRATEGLEPVQLDEGAPSVAAQAHADDMAKNGYLGHWGSDGSVPEQRYTEAGGGDMVLENALCFTDEGRRALDPHARINAADIEKSESMFFNEVPPNDGHRKNILKPMHRKVGIGIAQPVATATEIPVPCIAQEFTDPYGTYAAIPKRVKVGDMLHVEGEIHAPATVAGVGLARVDAPKPIAVAELNTRRSYLVPPPYQMYWPPGFKTPIPLVVKGGRRFAIDVPVSDKGRPGMYELSIWAKLPGSPDFAIVGLRTFRAE